MERVLGTGCAETREVAPAELAGGAWGTLTAEGALESRPTDAVVLACAPRKAAVEHVQHEPDVSVASVFGEITQLARYVPVDEEVTGRTEGAGVIGEGRFDHVLRAVATLRGEFGEDALVPGEAQAS